MRNGLRTRFSVISFHGLLFQGRKSYFPPQQDKRTSLLDKNWSQITYYTQNEMTMERNDWIPRTQTYISAGRFSRQYKLTTILTPSAITSVSASCTRTISQGQFYITQSAVEPKASKKTRFSFGSTSNYLTILQLCLVAWPQNENEARIDHVLMAVSLT